MARVYRYPQGAPSGANLEKTIALTLEAQLGVSAATDKVADRAKRILAAHEHDGHAEILVEDGKVDSYVVLSDDRGLGAAMTIEYGRKGDTEYRSGPRKGQPVAPMDAVAPLRLAVGMGKARVGANRVAGKRGRKAAARRAAMRKGRR